MVFKQKPIFLQAWSLILRGNIKFSAKNHYFKDKNMVLSKGLRDLIDKSMFLNEKLIILNIKSIISG